MTLGQSTAGSLPPSYSPNASKTFTCTTLHYKFTHLHRARVAEIHRCTLATWTRWNLQDRENLGPGRPRRPPPPYVL